MKDQQFRINKEIFNLPPGSPVIVCNGVGVDSAALLIALKRAGVRPDLITFADTNAEKPETYNYLAILDNKLQEWGFPLTTRCKHITTDRVQYNDLEGNCLDNQTLPSLAFGKKSCSIKWKQVPQDAVVKGVKSGPNKKDPHPIWLDAQARGVLPVKLIGYDAGRADIRRSGKLSDQDECFHYRYPLQALGWKREDCIRVIAEEGMPIPIKSACFFCPASKQWELFWLAGAHPDLLLRALNMEYRALTGKHSRFDTVEFGDTWERLVRNAERFPSSKSTVGLGRGFAWNHWARVNGIVDQDGVFIADRQWCLNEADRLRQSDNALDQRMCGVVQHQHSLFDDPEGLAA
jgi:hypothetical protein